jgi:Na+/H+-dicarboxylate symporter
MSDYFTSMCLTSSFFSSFFSFLFLFSIDTSLGKYVAVILGGNVIQFFIILPLFLLARGLNPVRTLGKMMPAVLMALFTKSSAATLPVTMQTAEDRLGVSNQVSRFVLPICTTINMNGCAAFILVTSLFLMQNGGMPLPWTTMILWLFISVISAVGNAGVPMGCYFLTLSLMSGRGSSEADRGYGLCQGICSRWQKDLSDRLQLLIEDGNH